jgi:hypothetical protein
VKKPKTQRRAPTQDELLKRAQETEEQNVIEHRDYLKAEDEKRERARLVRPVIEGRLVRWVSRVEEEVIPSTPPASPMPVASTSYGYAAPFHHSASYTAPPYTIGPGQSPYWGPTTPTPGPSSQGAYTGPPPYPSTFPYPQPRVSTTSSATRPLEPLPAVLQRKRKIAKNYVVLENAQTEKAPRVTWKQTMEGMFGNHAKWEEVKAYSTKNRPMCELISFCCAGLVHTSCDGSASEGEMPDYRVGRELPGPTNGCALCERLCVPGNQQGSRARLRLERGVWVLRRARRGGVRRRRNAGGRLTTRTIRTSRFSESLHASFLHF